MKVKVKVDLTVGLIDEWKTALFIPVAEPSNMTLSCCREAGFHTQLPACTRSKPSLIPNESRCASRRLLSRSPVQTQAGTPLRKSFFPSRCNLVRHDPYEHGMWYFCCRLLADRDCRRLPSHRLSPQISNATTH